MNQWRSPTAEQMYRRYDLINARSRGTSRKARRRICADDLKWADVIFVMERKHQQQLAVRFPSAITEAVVHVLDISDEYRFMDPALIQCLEEAMAPFLTD